jgi:hypothetical protein
MPKSLVVLGVSLGGVVSVLAAQKRPDLFVNVSLMLTMSSPLDAPPLTNSLQIFSLFRQIHEHSGPLPPLVQLYAGMNDLLVPYANSRLDKLLTLPKARLDVPMMRNVFFDVAHSEIPVDPHVARQVARSLTDCLLGSTNDRIVPCFERSARFLFPPLKLAYETNTTRPANATVIQILRQSTELTSGSVLIPDNWISNQPHLAYFIDVKKLGKVESGYMVITSLPREKVSIYYKTDDQIYEELDANISSFHFPLSYHLIPLNTTHMSYVDKVYLLLSKPQFPGRYQHRRDYAVHQTGLYYLGLLPITHRETKLSYNSLLSGMHINLSEQPSLQHSLQIVSSYPTDMLCFQLHITAKPIGKLEGPVHHGGLILLKQKGVSADDT